MTARMKAGLVLVVLFFANVAAWGARELLSATLSPLLRALGS
jgi:hypothetical protein